MTRGPTILERLQVAGLKPQLVAEFRDRHRRRTPCHCALCDAGGPPESEPLPVAPSQLAAFDEGGGRPMTDRSRGERTRSGLGIRGSTLENGSWVHPFFSGDAGSTAPLLNLYPQTTTTLDRR